MEARIAGHAGINMSANEFYEWFVAAEKRADGRCECCGSKFLEKKKEPVIDHCHLTGEPRGLLCVRCNTIEGLITHPNSVPVFAYVAKWREKLASKKIAAPPLKVEPRGERNGAAKLSSTQVEQIRQLRKSGAVYRELAHRFGVGITQIFRIVHGQHWTKDWGAA